MNVLNETEAQTTNLNTTEQNSVPKPKRDRKGMKREMIGLGLSYVDNRKNPTATTTAAGNAKAAISPSNSKESEEKEKIQNISFLKINSYKKF